MDRLSRVEYGNSVTHAESFFLVVGNEHKSDARGFLKSLEFCLHATTKLEVQGTQRLVQQQNDLIDQLQSLIDNVVPQDTDKYRAATVALEKVNTSLVAARQNIANVARTISQIAEVVGIVGELAASVK